jgi:hypothetical protein
MTWIKTIPISEADEHLRRAMEAQRELYPVGFALKVALASRLRRLPQESDRAGMLAILDRVQTEAPPNNRRGFLNIAGNQPMAYLLLTSFASENASPKIPARLGVHQSTNY